MSVSSVSKPSSAPTRSRRLTSRAAPETVRREKINNKLTDGLLDGLKSLEITSSKVAEGSSTRQNGRVSHVLSENSAANSTKTSSSLRRIRQASVVSSPQPTTSQADEGYNSKIRVPASIPLSNDPPASIARQAMSTVNSSLHTLTTLRKSGWRANMNSGTASTAKTPSSSSPILASPIYAAATNKKAEDSARECATSIATLRTLIREGKINNPAIEVEKAAGSLISNLVDMELFSTALVELAKMRRSILTWYDYPSDVDPPANVATSSNDKSSLSTYAAILTIPLPPSCFYSSSPTLVEALSSNYAKRPTLSEITPIVLLIQQYILGCLFRTDMAPKNGKMRAENVATAFDKPGSGSPWEWEQLYAQHLAQMKNPAGPDQKPVLEKIDAMLTSMFGTLTKGCVGVDAYCSPETLLSLRFAALRCLAATRSLSTVPKSLHSFYEQTRKVLLLYGRQAEVNGYTEATINEAVKKVYDQLWDVLCQKRVIMEGQSWLTLCEVVLHIAKRADDIAMMERMATCIRGAIEDPDPDIAATQNCAKLISCIAMLDKHFKVGGDNASAHSIRNSLITIATLSKLRCGPLSSNSSIKIDKATERLCHIVLKHVLGDRRLDQLMTGVAEQRASSTEKDALLWKLLDAIATYAEDANKMASASATSVESPSFFSGAIETLLAMAYFRLVVEDSMTFSPAFANLERCLPLVGIIVENEVCCMSPSRSVDYLSIRSLASAYYNIGATLYNADKPEAAIQFLKRSCEIGSAAIEADAEENRHGPNNRQSMSPNPVEDFKRHSAKRWELLALSYHACADRQLALDSYVKAITSNCTLYEAEITKLMRTGPFSDIGRFVGSLPKLVSRVTRLAMSELLLQPGQISLASKLRDADCPIVVSAAVLELQLADLDPHMAKVEAQRTAFVLIEDILALYTDDNQYSTLRARTLVRYMQLQCTCSVGFRMESTLSDRAKKIQSICIGGKSSFRRQYKAFSYLWLAYDAHQNSPDTLQYVLHNARECLRLLTSHIRETAEGGQEENSNDVLHSTSVIPTKVLKFNEGKPQAKAAAASTLTSFKTPLSRRTISGRTRAMPLASHPEMEPPQASGTPPNLNIAHGVLDNPVQCFDSLLIMANLLGALGCSMMRIAYLRLLRSISRRATGLKDSFVIISAYLGQEYARLGKMSKAGPIFANALAQAQILSKDDSLDSQHGSIMFYILYAEYLAYCGNHEESSQKYEVARLIAKNCTLETSAAGNSLRVLRRTLELTRSALASDVCSVIVQRRGDVSGSLAPAMQSLRAWSRALHNLHRLHSKPANVSDSIDPFYPVNRDKKDPLPDHLHEKRRMPSAAGPTAALSWYLAERMAMSYIRVAHLYLLRGTPKSAEHYALQAIEFAAEIGFTRISARAYATRAEIRMISSRFEDAQDDLQNMRLSIGDFACPEGVDLKRLQATLHNNTKLVADARLCCVAAQKMIDLLLDDMTLESTNDSPARQNLAEAMKEMRFSSLPDHSSHNRDEAKDSRILQGLEDDAGIMICNVSGSDLMLPVLQAAVLRMQAWLLRSDKNEHECRHILNQVARTATSEEDKAAEFTLLATLRFDDLLNSFQADPILSMFPEAVLSLPNLGTASFKTTGTTSRSPSHKDRIDGVVHHIEELLSKAVEMSLSRVEPMKLRNLSLLTAITRTVHTNCGKFNRRSPGEVASLLDFGSAITLRRDMLEAIDFRLDHSTLHDELIWPALDTVQITSHEKEKQMSQYWYSLRERYRDESLPQILSDFSCRSRLPQNWNVVSVHLTPGKDSVMLVRYQKGEDPIVFRLPLDRTSRREGEEETFSYAMAAAELQDIIATSNSGTQRAKDVKGKEERAAWWTERKELDERLKTLTMMMEQIWLGAFQAVFEESKEVDVGALSSFRQAIEDLLKRSIITSQDKKAAQFKLDETVLKCFVSLSNRSREEDLEDLYYYMIESFQLSGVPVSLDEIDMDQVVCDLKTALDDFQSANTKVGDNPDQHTFLILDKAFQAFPWESMPCLRGRSVSRIPSLAFLRDRLDLARVRQETYLPAMPHRITVNASQTAVILNPGGDLKTTQQAFEPWVQRMQKSGWSSIVGRAPSEEEMRQSLSNKDLVLYFGHGGAEQYIRSQTVRHLPKCAVTMLWGCSSGLLKDQGEFDPTGTPYHYMIAGCPALVANLWDVTDKDIDKFSETVFKSTGINESQIPETTKTVSLTTAVAEARDVCNLRYLNGAAVVVYGVPVYFDHM